MNDDEHTEFNAWAAELYSRPLTFWETVGACCFPLLVVVLVVLSPLLWLVTIIKRK